MRDRASRRGGGAPPPTVFATAPAGKKLLDKLKAEEDALRRAHPKSARLQPYKAQYMRLCKTYVDVMKEHQSAKVQKLIR